MLNNIGKIGSFFEEPILVEQKRELGRLRVGHTCIFLGVLVNSTLHLNSSLPFIPITPVSYPLIDPSGPLVICLETCSLLINQLL